MEDLKKALQNKQTKDIKKIWNVITNTKISTKMQNDCLSLSVFSFRMDIDEKFDV